MSTASPTSTDITAAFAEYLRRVRLRAPRTVENYNRVVRALQAHFDSESAMLHASTRELRAFLSSQTDGDVATARASWNARRSALRAFYAYVTATGARSDDPTVALERQRIPYREATVLSLQEMVRLVAAVQSGSTPTYRARNVALVQVMIHTALRVSEVCSLTIDQIDLQEHVFRGVRRKGAKVFDAVFNDVVAEALEDYLADRVRLVRDRSERALFLSDRGQPLAKRTLQETVTRYARLAGINRPVSPHALRHGCATALAGMGVPIRAIQDICGHASVATTQRYIHVAGRERHDAVDRLARAFRDLQGQPEPRPPP